MHAIRLDLCVFVYVCVCVCVSVCLCVSVCGYLGQQNTMYQCTCKLAAAISIYERDQEDRCTSQS